MKPLQGLYKMALGGGAIAYSSGMIAEAVLGWKLDPRVTLLSELAANDRPHRRIFRRADLVAGALFLTAGAVPQPRRANALRGCLAVFGAATIADALSPLDFPISHDSLAPENILGQEGRSISHRAHYLTTAVAGGAAAGICIVDWRARRRQGSSARQFAGPAIVLGQLAGLIALASPKFLPGLVQRVQTLGFTALCLDLARIGIADSSAPPMQADAKSWESPE